ncbi:hypothetical protein [Acidiferrobacter sp.]|uniref:sodium-dependent transporter n=1 Tax=Acidiferrobacter sp. TaxID=1872107 RepID=UPI002602F861|nr:hypothetical protein [Acidiferrobacter sp.]
MSGASDNPVALWSSLPRFFLAGLGALAGMDSFSEFPYLLAHYGGGTFVWVYATVLLVIAWPLFAGELTVGRRIGADSATAATIAQAVPGRAWRWAVRAAALGGFLMLCYVAVVAGWMLSYLHAALAGDFRGATAAFVEARFAHLASEPWRALAWQAVFLVLVFLIAAGGLRAIEELSYLVVPGLLALFAVLLVFAATRGSFFVSAPALLAPRAAPSGAKMILVALSQAFFGPGLGTAALLAYGVSLRSSVSAGRVALALVLAQVFIAWLGGFALASLVYAAGLNPLAGGGFLFETLPLLGARLPHGALVAALCYLGLISAAWLSCVAWLEPAMQLLTARGLPRARAALGLGLAAFVTGTVLTLSLKSWAFSFTFFGRLKTLGLLDVVMIVAVNVLLPWGAGGLSLIMGWAPDGLFGRGKPLGGLARLWFWALRLLVPAAVLVVILTAPRLVL